MYILNVIFFSCVSLLIFFLSQSVHAADSSVDVGMGLRAGTFGYGLDLGVD